MKMCILIIASVLCVAEASFRSEDDYKASVRRAITDNGAELIVLSIEDNGLITQSNATYLGNGRALTHGHETFGVRVLVISLWGYDGAKSLPCSVHGDININVLQTDFPRACKSATAVRFPSTRRLVPRITTIAKLPGADEILDRLDFGPEYEIALARSELGIARTDGAFTGPDFCILEFAPYSEGHPIAVLADAPFAAGKITIRGCSQFIHYGMTFPIIDILKRKRAKFIEDIKRDFKINDCRISKEQAADMNRIFEERAASELIKVPLALMKVCFSQSVRPVEDRLIARAVCSHEEIASDEIFDLKRTPATIEAIIVSGLSGGGVYDEADRLVGLVSRANRPEIVATMEQSADPQYAKLLPDVAEYPLFNVHQLVTADMLIPLLNHRDEAV